MADQRDHSFAIGGKRVTHPYKHLLRAWDKMTREDWEKEKRHDPIKLMVERATAKGSASLDVNALRPQAADTPRMVNSWLTRSDLTNLEDRALRP